MKAIHTGWTLEHALECAREGRPDMLLMMIGEQMGQDVGTVLADLMFKHPEKLRVRRREAYLPHEAKEIREYFAALVRANPRKKPAIIRDELAPQLGLESNTLRDIIEQKKTYAPKDGEQVHKRSPRKRKK